MGTNKAKNNPVIKSILGLYLKIILLSNNDNNKNTCDKIANMNKSFLLSLYPE